MTDERLEQLFSIVITKIDALEDRMTKLEDRVLKLEDRITKLEDRITKLEDRVTEMDARLTAKIEQNTTLIVDIEDRLCKRMDKLEETMNAKYELLSHELNGVKLQVESLYMLHDYKTGNCLNLAEESHYGVRKKNTSQKKS